MIKQRFTVSGSGFFPLDMLRYDYCYPVSMDDVEKIDTSVLKGPRVIQLERMVKNRNIQPAEDRWLSFGWEILGNVRLVSS